MVCESPSGLALGRAGCRLAAVSHRPDGQGREDDVGGDEKQPLTDPEPLAREIGRIGVNVNWIAHWANRNERITPEQVEEVTASFHRVEELLGRLFEDKREARGRAE
jgi:hypothetical protein